MNQIDAMAEQTPKIMLLPIEMTEETLAGTSTYKLKKQYFWKQLKADFIYSKKQLQQARAQYKHYLVVRLCHTMNALSP